MATENDNLTIIFDPAVTPTDIGTKVLSIALRADIAALIATLTDLETSLSKKIEDPTATETTTPNACLTAAVTVEPTLVVKVFRTLLTTDADVASALEMFFEVRLAVDVVEVANPESVNDSNFEDATLEETPADNTTMKARTAEAAIAIELETNNDLLTALRTATAADEPTFRIIVNARTKADATVVVIEAAIFFATVFA